MRQTDKKIVVLVACFLSCVLLYILKIFLEAEDPFPINILESRFLIAIVLKMLQTTVPVTPVPLRVLLLEALFTQLRK